MADFQALFDFFIHLMSAKAVSHGRN
jgi:hypothetical protein